MADFSDAENERIRALIHENLGQGLRWVTKVEVAKAIGISGPSLSRILQGKGASLSTAEGLAKALGQSLDWVLGRDMSGARYPNAQAAAVFARSRGISEEAIEAVLTDQLLSDHDPSPDEWLQEMMRMDLELRGKIQPVRVDWEAKKASSRPRWPTK